MAALLVAVLASGSVGLLTSLADDVPEPTTAEDGASDPLDALVELMLEVPDDALRRDVLKGMHVALRGRRALGVPTGWTQLYPQLVESDDAEVRELAILLAVAFRDKAALRSLLKTVGDDEVAAGDRIRAIGALADANEPNLGPVLLKIVAAVEPDGRSDDDQAVLAAAVRNLASAGNGTVPKLLLSRYDDLAGAQRDAVATLSSRSRWALELLDAVADGRIPRGDVSAFDARQMAGLENEVVSARLSEVWGNVRSTRKDRDRLVKRYRAELTADALADADLSAGRAVFAKTCAGCHRLFDAGRQVGPELTGSQRSNVDYVLQNLVDPNAIIGRDFQVTTVVTSRGRVLNGLVAEETYNVLVLKTSNDDVTVAKADVEERSLSNVSMMPEGMLDKLTPTERRNLVAYLRSPEQVALPASDE